MKDELLTVLLIKVTNSIEKWTLSFDRNFESLHAARLPENRFDLFRGNPSPNLLEATPLLIDDRDVLIGDSGAARAERENKSGKGNNWDHVAHGEKENCGWACEVARNL
jgi:hypothetical protein